MILLRRFAWVLLFACAPLAAQHRIQPERLPADTFFYFHWRGEESLGASREKNPLIGLWRDPELAPMRDAVATRLTQEIFKGRIPAEVSPADIWAMLGCEMLFGHVQRPGLAKPATVPADPQGEPPPAPRYAPNEFLIVNYAGKEELAKKMNELVPPDPDETIVTEEFRGITIGIATGKRGTYYQADFAPWHISAGDRKLFEELIVRFEAATAPADSLTQSERHRRALQQAAPGTFLVFFMQFVWDQMGDALGSQDVRVVTALRGLGFEKFHGMTMNLRAAGDTGELRVAILGDTSPGSFFDLLGANQTREATLAYAPAKAYSFASAQVDLPATYKLVRDAALAALPPEQFAAVGAVEGMIEAQLGLPLGELLAQFGGEFGMIAPQATADPLAQLFIITLRQPERVLQVLRKLFAPMIVSESEEGDATLLTLLFSRADPQTKEAKSTAIRVAVTPGALLVARDEPILRDALRLRAAGPDAAGRLVSDASYRQARARLPESLSALSYSNLTAVNWDALLAEMEKTMREQAEKQAAADPQKAAKDAENLRQVLDWMRKFPPSVLKRHLHTMVSGCRKDATGLYCDGFVN